MNKKQTKRNSDFFSHAKTTVGKKRYNAAIAKGKQKANELRLKAARELLGLSQTDLKNLSQPDVSKIESRKDVKLSTLQKYAEALGMKLKVSLEGDDDESISIPIYG